MVKGDKLNKSITVPAHVPDVARVQIWCAWAEALLGEAGFEAVQVRAACAKKAEELRCVSTRFQGAKADAGTVTATMSGTQLVLTLSDDFKIPDTPAPHWQVVDSKGNTHLLQRLKIKGDKLNRTVVVPATIGDRFARPAHCDRCVASPSELRTSDTMPNAAIVVKPYASR